jgi:uncharacterized membrane protein YedE/YeeE
VTLEFKEALQLSVVNPFGSGTSMQSWSVPAFPHALRVGGSRATLPPAIFIIRHEADMANFTPVSAAIGGALIGLAAVLLMLFTGRIAGISGIAGGLFNPRTDDRLWRLAFVAGLTAAPIVAALVGHAVPMPQMPGSMITIAAAGLLVGFGTRLGSGCTSGHGICGIARLSPRSIAATLVFMIAAIIVVALTHHVIGG